MAGERRLAVQMETQRWPRGAGEDGEVTAAPLAEAAGRRGTNLLCTCQFLSWFWLPGFQEINSNCCDLE